MATICIVGTIRIVSGKQYADIKENEKATRNANAMARTRTTERQKNEDCKQGVNSRRKPTQRGKEES